MIKEDTHTPNLQNFYKSKFRSRSVSYKAPHSRNLHRQDREYHAVNRKNRRTGSYDEDIHTKSTEGLHNRRSCTDGNTKIIVKYDDMDNLKHVFGEILKGQGIGFTVEHCFRTNSLIIKTSKSVSPDNVRELRNKIPSITAVDYSLANSHSSGMHHKK